MIDNEFIERCNKFAKNEWKNVDRQRIYIKKWNDTNRVFLRECIRKYSKSEKGKISSKRRNAIRNKRVRDLILDLSDEEIEKIKIFYVNCPIGFEVDHIIPIAKGGSHSLSNLQYLTKEENRKKSCRLDWQHSIRDKKLELNIDPHNPPPKKRRIMRSSLKVVP